MKRNNPYTYDISSSNKDSKTVDLDDLKRTNACFQIFSLELYTADITKAFLDDFYKDGLLNSELIRNMLNHYNVTEKSNETLSDSDLLEALKNKLLDNNSPSVCFCYIVDDFIIRGVYINRCSIQSGKSFIHHYYNFIEKADNDLEIFLELIHPENDQSILFIKYHDLMLDKPFLDELVSKKEWMFLARIRGSSLTKCVDQDQIEALVNDQYRTDLCIKIFNWNVKDKAQTTAILLEAIQSKALYHIVNESSIDVDDYKCGKDKHDEFSSCLVQKLLQDGVDINHHLPNEKSFVHQYYLFEEAHPNGGEGFFQITRLNKKLIIDGDFLNHLLNIKDWYTLSALIINPKPVLVIQTSFEFHARLTQGVNEDRARCETELTYDKQTIENFLNCSNKLCCMMSAFSKFLLFKSITSDYTKTTYLPSEIRDNIVDNLLDVVRHNP